MTDARITDTPVTDKVAIITGAARGIGCAITRHLATMGYCVVINYAQSAAAAEDLATEIRQDGGRALTVQADIGDAAAVSRLFSQAETCFGGVDVLINNAGILKLAKIADADDAHIHSQIATNLTGSLYTMREAARRLRPGGRIINLSTSVIGLKLESYGVYAATKAAIEAATTILAKEMRGRSITVNAIAPGPTATDLFLEGKSPELVERMAQMAPLERLGTPDDIAAVIAFLVGPQGGWVNGQIIRANGGIV